MSEEPQYVVTMRFGHSFTDHRECHVQLESDGGAHLWDVPSVWPIYAVMALGLAVNPPVFLVAFAISFVMARAGS